MKGPDPFKGWWSKSTEERLDVFRPMFEFNIGVATGIMLPFTPISSLYGGEDPETVAAQSAGSALATWITLTALGGAEFGAVPVVRSVLTKGAISALTPAIPLVAAAKVTEEFIDFHEAYQPAEPTHQPSWWNSIAAAMGGTFGGMQYE